MPKRFCELSETEAREMAEKAKTRERDADRLDSWMLNHTLVTGFEEAVTNNADSEEDR